MLNAIPLENKSTLLTGTFNINFINYNKKEAQIILPSYPLTNFTPQITLPTRVTEKSAALIDNIFVNNHVSSIFLVISQLQFLTIFETSKFQRKQPKERMNKN